MTRCPMCSNIGWVLDANGAGLTPPLSLELIECFYPECPVAPLSPDGGRPEPPEIASIVFKGPRFHTVARHSADGYVMSVSADVLPE